MQTTRRSFLRRSVLAAAGLGVARLGRGAAPSPARPHIVLFVSDDHGVDDSGAYGDTVVRTPAVDRLARDGMRCTRAFAASPLCSPSRCVLETGLMPFRNGGHKFGTPIRAGVRTMPMHFRTLGYHTAHVGKFHHAPRKQFPYDTVIRDENGAPAFIARCDGAKPLLLLVCSHSPHTPWTARSDYDPSAIKLPPTFVDTPETRAERARYYAEVTAMDRQLGDVLAALEKRGWANNTLVVYTTDQGSNWPFAKWCLYDAGIRVPFIARWPGRIRPGSVTGAMVSLADLLPTFLDAAGATPPEDIDGRSFLGVLLGRTKEHRDAIFACHTGNDNGGPGIANQCPMRAVRTPRYKYILNLHPERTFYTHIVGCKPPSPHHLSFWASWVERAKTDSRARRVVDAYLHRPKQELYDIAADPHEQHNLAGEAAHADTLVALRGRLTAWRKQQGDPELTGS
jgi:uncharacterized sulfatase